MGTDSGPNTKKMEKTTSQSGSCCLGVLSAISLETLLPALAPTPCDKSTPEQLLPIR